MLFLRLFNILRWVFIWLSVSSQRVPEMSSEFSFAAKTKHWSLMDFPFAPRMKESRGMREPPAGGTRPQAAPALRDEQATHRRLTGVRSWAGEPAPSAPESPSEEEGLPRLGPLASSSSG